MPSAKAQDKALGAYVRSQLYAYSTFYRRRLDDAGVGREVSGRDELGRLPVVRLDDVDDPSLLVLRPEERTIQRFAEFRLVRKLFWAKLTGRQARFYRTVVEPRYKPVHWHVQEGIPVASSVADLRRTSELGRRWLEVAGVLRSDVVLGILPPGPNLPYWELVLACHKAGVSAMHLDPQATPDQVAAVQPSVVVGRADDVESLLTAVGRERRRMPGLRLVLVAGDRPSDVLRRRLRHLAPEEGVSVTFAWAPPGVRALWAECQGGETLHTWPDTELVEVVDPLTGGPVLAPSDGEVVWTAIGWNGTAFARLATGFDASLEDGPCPTCAREGPRLRPAAGEDPAFVAVLDGADGVVAWQAELRTVDGVEELIVFVALDRRVERPGRLLRALDRQLSVTQFVVEDRRKVQARLANVGHRRVLDYRAQGDRAVPSPAGW